LPLYRNTAYHIFASSTLNKEEQIMSTTPVTPGAPEGPKHLSGPPPDLTKFLADYIRAEMNLNWQQIKERRARQLHYLRTYMIALGVLLSIAAFGLDPANLATEEVKRAYGLFGLAILSLVVAAGCCYTLFLGYNYRGLLIAKRNLVGLARLVRSIATKHGAPLDPYPLCIESRPGHVRVTGAFSTAHYWMLYPNAVVSLGSVYFLFYIWGGWLDAIDVGALLLAAFAAYYPQVCLGFNRYMIIAALARPGRPESVARQIYKRRVDGQRERNRRSINVLWVVLIVALLTLAAASIANLLARRFELWEHGTPIVVGLFLVFLFVRIAHVRYSLIQVVTKPGRSVIS
jgi:hypothetical protein